MALTNKHSKYHIIVDSIKSSINSGKFKPGDFIDSENQLKTAYETSRVTVRKALNILSTEGYLKAVQGKGYLVSEPELENFRVRLFSDGKIPETELISVDIIDPSVDIRIQMHLLHTGKIIEMKRFYLADGRKAAYSCKYMPYSHSEPILEKEFHYINMEDKAKNAYCNTLKVRSAKADAGLAAILEIDADEPILEAEILTENDKNETISFEKILFVGKSCTINGY